MIIPWWIVTILFYCTRFMCIFDTNVIIKVDGNGAETIVSCFSLREGVLQGVFLHGSTACLFLFNRVQDESRETCRQLSWSVTTTDSLTVATSICRKFCCLGYCQTRDIIMHHPYSIVIKSAYCGRESLKLLIILDRFKSYCVRGERTHSMEFRKEGWFSVLH